MSKKDARVDAYIAKSAEFAKPILKHFRQLVHEACPEVEETIKWSFPHFMREGILCSMAAFKAHCAIHFWQGSARFDLPKETEGMGQFGRITSLADLPKDKALTGYIKEAARMNVSGLKKVVPAKPKKKQDLIVPDCIKVALKGNARAAAAFEGFSPSHKREYVEWISEAKREETRERRLKTMLEWLAEGKPRNWKYMNC